MEKTRKNNAGFSLIELMIVIAIIAVIVAIAVPSLLKSIQVSQETAGLGTTRTISTAQLAFKSAYIKQNDDDIAEYGSLTELADPHGDGSAGFIERHFNGKTRKGAYEYTVTTEVDDTNKAVYTLVASADDDKMRSFFTDESGMITWARGEDPGPDSNAVE